MTLAQIDELGWVNVLNGDDAWYRWWRLDHLRGGPPPERGTQLNTPNELMIAIRNGHGICTTLASIRDMYSFEGLALVPLTDVPPVPLDVCVRHDADRSRLEPLVEALCQISDGYSAST